MSRYKFVDLKHDSAAECRL